MIDILLIILGFIIAYSILVIIPTYVIYKSNKKANNKMIKGDVKYEKKK